MTGIIRLYYGRDTDDMIRRLRISQDSDDDEPIQALEVRETVLEEEVIEAIVDLLCTRSVNTVQLDDCGAYLNRQAIRMARALGTVQNVRLSEPTFLSHFFLDSLLISATKLTNLRIQDHLDCRQTERLSLGLEANRTVKVLDLSRSRLDSFQILADGIRRNCGLIELKLRSLGLNDENSSEILDAVVAHSTLETLDLSFNRFQNLESLNGLIMQSKISELYIGYQNVWQTPMLEVGEFSNALRDSKSLKTLSLARNKLGDMSACKLAAAIAHNDTLEQLDLRENRISDNGILSLAKALEETRGIRHLNIVGNNFHERGSLALLRALKTNFSLIQIDVRDADFASRQIRYAAALNRCGRRLLYEDTPLSLWPMVLERINKTTKKEQEKPTSFSSLNEGEVSYNIDVLHFMLKGPVLFEGAVCA